MLVSSSSGSYSSSNGDIKYEQRSITFTTLQGGAYEISLIIYNGPPVAGISQYKVVNGWIPFFH
jgi:hypothetical protein